MVERDPPHHLKALTTTTTPQRLLWLACRGYIKKRRGHYEQRFQTSALGTTHWTARKRIQKDTLTTHNTPDDLWDAVAAFCPVGRRVVLFTYDLAEQMRLSAMLTHLPANGWTLDKIVLERSAAWCLLRNGKRSLMCCDLKSWAPVPWEKIVTDSGIRNHDSYVIRAGEHYADTHCYWRCAVIRAAVLQILSFIEGESNGPFRPTGSGQSYAAYRRHLAGTRLLVHDDYARLNAERLSMHTGRAEAWRHGHLRHGPYVEYDLHAAYATIGRDCSVPTVARAEYRSPKVSRIESAIDNYAVLADVTVNTDVECLPCRIGTRTVWPVGEFRTWLWDPELRLAFAYANSIKIHHAYTYHRGPALHDFCKYVLDNMEGQTQIYGPIVQRVLKHWSRCLVGRLGLRYRLWHKFGPQDPPDVRLVQYHDIEDGTTTDLLLAGSEAMLLGEMQEAPESLPQIPGWVMSECRRRLWDAMAHTGLDRLTYVDTDSVILGKGNGPFRTPDLWHATDAQWVRKGAYPSLTIYGPRALHVGHDRRFAGIPLDARQDAPLEFDGTVMRSVKASMRDGELDLVVSMPRTFHVKPKDLRRIHNPDGSTSPYRLELPCS